jgi:hypothetical protein
MRSARLVAVDNAQVDAVRALGIAKDDALKGFKEDTPKALRTSFLWAAGVVVLLTLSIAAADWVKLNWLPDYHKIARSEAEKILQDRVAISATPDSTEKTELKRLIDGLNNRIDALEKKK